MASASTIDIPNKTTFKRLVYKTRRKAKTAYCYEIKPGRSEKPKCESRMKKLAEKASKMTATAAGTVCKKTGKAIKKTGLIWPIRILLGILDIIGAPYGSMRGRDINFPLLWKAGAILLVLDVWIYLIIGSVGAEVAQGRASSNLIVAIAQTLIPGALGLGALSLIIGGIRLQQGKSFSRKYGAELEPLPAFETGIVFKIGDIKLSLRDMHTNIGAFGGIGTGKTVSVMIPLMRQFFQQLNHDTDDPDDEAQKVAALILDEKGDFIDSTIMEMMLAGRPITDLVLIDPDLDLFRYNPLDPSQSADENAEKLGKVQKIISGGGGNGDNKYWDDTSKATIKFFLQLLEVYKPKEKIGLDDVARFMRDDQLATILCNEVEAKIEAKKEANEINEETYGMIYDAISSTRNQWINLAQNTKSILKTTINQMLSSLASNPRLQKVFCRDTNFSFRDLPNKGKIVLFRGSGIDKATAKLICVCLKIDFQTWQKRRNGSAASAYGLNTTRTVLFICDEYQEFVTCGDEGDQTFYGVSRSARTCAIVATQSLNSLKGPIRNQEQTNTLIQNITTWIFLRTTDKDTMELGALWAGQSKQEDYSQSQNIGGLIEISSNLSGASGKDSSVNISRKLEENFRKDDFSKLITMTMEKSRTGPWYSEAIVYHYHDTDAEAESRCYKTKIPHYYYDKELRKRAGSNVSHLDNLLYDRNWQRKTLQRALVEIARARAKAADNKKTFLEKMATSGKIAPAQNPEEKRRARILKATTHELDEQYQETISKIKGKKLSGEVKQAKGMTPEDLAAIKEKRHKLMADQANATSEVERKMIEREIGRLNHLLAFNQLQALSRSTNKPGTIGKEVLEANRNYFNMDNDPKEITEPAEKETPESTETPKNPENSEETIESHENGEEVWDPMQNNESEDLNHYSNDYSDNDSDDDFDDDSDDYSTRIPINKEKQTKQIQKILGSPTDKTPDEEAIEEESEEPNPIIEREVDEDQEDHILIINTIEDEPNIDLDEEDYSGEIDQNDQPQMPEPPDDEPEGYNESKNSNSDRRNKKYSNSTDEFL